MCLSLIPSLCCNVDSYYVALILYSIETDHFLWKMKVLKSTAEATIILESVSILLSGLIKKLFTRYSSDLSLSQKFISQLLSTFHTSSQTYIPPCSPEQNEYFLPVPL